MARVGRPAGVVLVGIRREPAALVPAHGRRRPVRTSLDDYFDTANAGPKREAASYRRIADTLGVSAGLVFLSDVPAELDAAREAGWATVGLARSGEPQEDADFGSHPVVASFADIRVLPVSLDRDAS